LGLAILALAGFDARRFQVPQIKLKEKLQWLF
jgi:hypothetical protein